MHLNLAIEKAWRDAKRAEGWEEKQIKQSIEKLEHIREARTFIQEQMKKKRN